MFASTLTYSIILLAFCWSYVHADSKTLLFLEVPEILKVRGYKVEIHEVITKDGYILQISRATNPMIKSKTKKNPLLFIHGIITTGNCFLINSDGVEPKDFSNYNVSSMSEDELDEILKDEPSSHSLPFLALNFGREVWMLNRRGAPGSQRTIDGRDAYHDDSGVQIDIKQLSKSVQQSIENPTKLFTIILDTIQQFTSQTTATINSNFWNYTYDQQAAYDVPDTIDYILNATESKQVDIVGHSAGGALVLMALIANPELSNKISHAALWAPAFYLGYDLGDKIRAPLLALFQDYIGSAPPLQSVKAIQSFLVALCLNDLSRKTFCTSVEGLIFGKNGGQNPINTDYLTSLLNSVSGRELAQFYQCSRKKGMHYFDYINSIRNQIAYGQDKPPKYELNRIKSKNLAIWAGNTDAFVGTNAIGQLVKDIDVQVPLKTIGPYFNHLSFHIHQNVSTLLHIPTLRFIESPSK